VLIRWPLDPPEIFEPRRRQFGVAHRVLDIFVAEIRLQRPGVVAFVGERVAAGVPQHVRVRLEPKFGLGCCSLNHPSEPGRSHALR
jgi:hypothetical protein